MNAKIRIGICGYGNLGKGVESEIAKNADMELGAIFTRRRPVESLNTRTDAPTVHLDDVMDWTEKIDIMVLCGGSKSDLPTQGPEMARLFNTVDSFDTHAKIPEYFKAVDGAAKEGGKTSIISIGWDPGLFSLQRLYSSAIIPGGTSYSFWGPGVSQGHSEAIRGIDGVKNAIQYTIPNMAAMERVRKGENPELTAREKHTRECYIVAAEGADKNRIESECKTMPDYFADYDTTVRFISDEEFEKNHSKTKHGGNVIHHGKTGDGNNQMIEFSLKLDANPEFTASVLIAYARAAYRLSKEEGTGGAWTIFDIPPVLLSPANHEELIARLL